MKSKSKQAINIVVIGKDKKSKAICSVFSLRSIHVISKLSPMQKKSLFNTNPYLV